MEKRKSNRTQTKRTMMQIFQYPHETLTQVSTEWKSDDSIQGYADIEKFEKDYIKIMVDEKGMGLAANQIGITKRFFAMGHESFDTFKNHAIIWNPKVLKFSEEKVIDLEVQYETTQGKTEFAKLDGMESKCFQHELDHLDGITFNKRVSKLRWQMANKG